MDIYQVNHQQLLKGIRCNFQRYLYKQIQWDDRLIGIFGSQGVGKTTLLLQRIKQAFDDSDKALYLNLDSILFQREKMVNVAMQFYKEGGTHLFLDSVHRYADWMAETRKFLESLGFTVGGTVTVVSDVQGSVIVNVRDSRVAVGKDIAMKVMV